jgi:predicted RNA binding protein YcfA (HicA-like mRNA interferase family)
MITRNMPKAARILAALKRDGWTETRRRGTHLVLVKDDRPRVWAYHERVRPGRAGDEVDSRGRVSLGRAGAEPARRYRVARDIDGVLLLTPVVCIPSAS